MARWTRIIHDRVAMLKKGLGPAGYLIGRQTEEERTASAFEELAADVIADLLHLGVDEYKAGIKINDSGVDPDNLPKSSEKFDTYNAIAAAIERSTKAALDDFKMERYPKGFTDLYS